MSQESSAGIFAGLRVLDLTSGMAGPMATMVLADHGADVVKIEPPAGEWARPRPAFAMWNRGKRSVRCDLHDEADRLLVRELAHRADVIFDSGDFDVLRRCGADPAWIETHNPGAVVASIAGFPPGGPLSALRAYEGVVSAAVGRMTELDQLSGGRPGHTYDEPAFTAAPIASYGASQIALQGVLAALLQRARTGRGQFVRTSLLHGAMAFLMRQELARGGGGTDLSISPAAHRGIEMCFLTAECADGRYIQMCARQDQHFRNWLTALGLAEVFDEPRYARAPMGIPTVDDVVELEQRLRERMRTRTQAEWMRAFTEEFDVGADPFLTPIEFLDHPDMVANDRVVEFDDPTFGRVRQVGALVEMSLTPARIDRPSPPLGEADEPARRGELWAEATSPLPTVRAVDEAPLRGVTIVEVAYFIAGPMATTLLAELGARVIKVEPLDGDPFRRTGLQSAKFVQGKESVTLDLKAPPGAEALRRLISAADVVVHSFRSGPARKLGLDADTVLAHNPRAVHLYAASYGSRGPQRDRAAFHSTPNALSGGGIKQAGDGNPPVNDSYADPGSALGAATAILLGLWARHTTGRGQALETTMLTSTGYIHSADLVAVDGRIDHAVADADQRGLDPWYRLYRAADGWVFVAAVTAAERSRIGQALGATESLGEAVGSRPVAEVVKLLGSAGVGVAPVAAETFDRWLEREGYLIEAGHPFYGDYWRVPPKVQMSGSEPVLGPACAVGEHSLAILAEFGFAAPEIAELVAGQVTSDGRPG
ncbi:MAG TPA: CoA transferase [Ilumatobacter sp.]|nr:CoA transferase [Ilumatobacter sp.]